MPTRRRTMTDLKKTTPGPSKQVSATKASEPPGSKLKTDPTGEATHQRRFPEVDEDVDDHVHANQARQHRTEDVAPVLDANVEIVNRVNAKIKWNQSVAGNEKFEICYWTDEADKKYNSTNSSNHILTKLKTGSTYLVKVTRVNIDGHQPAGTSNTVHFDTAPAQPTDLRVENYESSPPDSIIVCFNDPNENREVTHEVLVEAVTANVAAIYPAIPQGVELVHEDDKLILTWQAIEIKPSHYEVQWEANGVKTISEVSEETFTLDELKLSTNYKFRVAAVNKAGQSYLSEEKSHQTVPSPPMNVRVQKNAISPTSSFIVKYEDPDPLKKSYEAFATSLEGEIVSRARSGTHTAVLSNLPAGRAHFIYVIAYYGDDMSERAYCTQNAKYPSGVINLHLRDFLPNNTKATIVWEVPEKTKFRIRWWINGREEQESITNIPAFTFDNLEPSCRYNFQAAWLLQQNGKEYRGDYSDILTFQTAPRPPTRLRVLPGIKSPMTSFFVEYDDNESDDKKYKVSVKDVADGQSKSIVTNELFANVDCLSPGASYIVSVTSTQNGVTSKPCKLDKPAQTHPAQVTGLSVQKSSSISHTISWSRVYGAQSYHLKWRRIDGNFKSMQTTDNQVTLSNLDIGQVFQFCVAAVNPSSTGEYSEIKEFCTDPAPPFHVNAVIIYSGDNISTEVNFTAVEQQDIKEYVIELVSEATTEQINKERPTKVKRVPTTCAVFNHLEHSTRYVPCVSCISENGVESRKVYGDPIWTRPVAVKGLRNTPVSRDSEKIVWQEVEGASSYILAIQEERDEHKTEREINGNETTLTNLSLNTTISVSVAARNNGGVGKFSSPITFRTALAPPSNIGVSNLPSHPECDIVVTWNPSDGALQYNIDIVDVKQRKKEDHRITSKCCEHFSNLQPGHEYKVTVQALASDTKRHSGIGYSHSIWTYCDQVQGVDAKLVSPSTVNITWDRTEGAGGYMVTCNTRSDGSSIQLEATTNQLTMSHLELGETYGVTISPQNQAGFGKETIPVIFRTGLAPVSDVKVFIIDVNLVKVQFTEPQNKPPAYRVLVVPTSSDENGQPKLTKRKHCIVTGLSPGTEHVAYVWSTDPDAPELNSEKSPSKDFFTVPPIVEGVKVINDSRRSRHITWNITSGSSAYVVKLKKAGARPIYMPPTKSNEFHVDKLDLHSRYIVTVRAQNAGGEGSESEEVRFETQIHPPKSIKVTNDLANPTNTLKIQIVEPDMPSTYYQLRIISLNGGPDRIEKMTRQQAISVKTLGGMTPGDSYQLAICSLHDTDENLNSKEKFSNVIQTMVPPLTIDIYEVSNDIHKLTWSPGLAVTSYRVSWRSEHGRWLQKNFDSGVSETLLEELEPGSKYEVKVEAINTAGEGQDAKLFSFTTAPATPTDVTTKLISPREVEISCKEMTGATKYIFRIDGQIHERQEPLLILDHGFESKSFQIQISAENEGGVSRPSTALHCNQILLQLQAKFLRKARINFEEGRFIPPVFIELPDQNIATDFGTEEFQIGNGNTVCIIGSNFSGKTSCCSNYIHNLQPDMLGVFFDWDDYKNSGKLNIKSVLLKQMGDFTESEKNHLFEWMECNSDKIIFVIDNLCLPDHVDGKLISHREKATSQEIFYSLVATSREMFLESQILCTTSQNNLRQIIRPSRTLEIVGFSKMQKREMRDMILGEKSDVTVPKHLEYFCKNPYYCKIVLHLLKHIDPNVDMDSYSSVLVKLLSESFGLYPAEKKKEKLHHLFDEIMNVPQRAHLANIDPSQAKDSARIRSDSSDSTCHFKQTSSCSDSSGAKLSSVAVNNQKVKQSCKSLHHDAIQAMYLGLFCPSTDFINHFHKKTIDLHSKSIIWVLTTGLLREETVNYASEIFEAIGENLMRKEIENKLQFMKAFIKDNFDRIHEQVLMEPQIALDWLNVINEVKGFEIIPKSGWKISVKKSHTTYEIEQMTSFLRQVREMFFDVLQVKFEKDIEPEKRLEIETAMRHNLYGKIPAGNSDSGNFSGNPSTNERNFKWKIARETADNVVEDQQSKFSETSFTVKLQVRPGQRRHGMLLYAATSMSTGKVITVESMDGTAVFERIDPGDKYSIFVYEEVDNTYSSLVAKSEFQTRKVIDAEGDKVQVGDCTLSFIPGAVKTKTRIAVSACTRGTPPIPDQYWSIMPAMKFSAAQKNFSKQVKCKLHLPHVTVAKTVKVEVLSIENDEWKKLCSTHLKEDGTVEFYCDHLSTYAVVIAKKQSILPLTMRMRNTVYCSKNGNYVGVTCLDNQWIINSYHTELSDNYTKSQFEIKSFDMTVDTVATYLLRCTRPEQRICQWQVAFDHKFMETWVNKMQMRLSHDDEQLYGIPLITLLFEREYAGNATQWKINERNPFKFGEAASPEQSNGADIFDKLENIEFDQA